MHIALELISCKFQLFMDIKSVQQTKEKLDMLKTTQRLETNLSDLTTVSLRSAPYTQVHKVGGNFMIDIGRCVPEKVLSTNKSATDSVGIVDNLSEENTRVRRDREVPRSSPSPSGAEQTFTESFQREQENNDQGLPDSRKSAHVDIPERCLPGRYALTSMQTCNIKQERARKRSHEKSERYPTESDLDESSGYDRRSKKKSTSDDLNEYPNGCLTRGTSDPKCENILSRMYASFGKPSHEKKPRLHESPTTTSFKRSSGYESNNRSYMNDRIEEFNFKNRYLQEHGSNSSEESGGRQVESVHKTREISDNKREERACFLKDDLSSPKHAVKSHSYRKRFNPETSSPNFSDDSTLPPNKNSMPSKRDMQHAKLGNVYVRDKETHSYGIEQKDNVKSKFKIDAQKTSNCTRHSFSSAMPTQSRSTFIMNDGFMLPFRHGGIGSVHDPSVFLKSASLAAANPFLFGMNACMLNPVLLHSLEQSEIMAAAAYRQAVAARILQEQAAGMKPFLNFGLMDNPSLYHNFPHFMYALPDRYPIANSLLETGTHESSSSIASNMQPAVNHISTNRSSNVTADQRDESLQDRSDTFCSTKPCDTDDSISLSTANSRKRTADELQESPLRLNLDRKSLIDTLTDSRRSLVSPKKSTSCAKKCNSVHSEKSPKRGEKVINTSQKKRSTSASEEVPKIPSKDLLRIDLLSANEEKASELSSDEKSVQAESKSSSFRSSSYKNLTRERRLVANARERTRVHTISSAFEELRQQIPSYSYNQKLSKLAILRIACSYIQSLSVLAGRTTEGTFKESVDQCTHVLQAETKARCRRKNTKSQVEWEISNFEKSTGAPVKQPEYQIWQSSSSPRESHVESPEYCPSNHDRTTDDGNVGDSSNESETFFPPNTEQPVDGGDSSSGEVNERNHSFKQSSGVYERANSYIRDQSPINVED